MSLPGYGDVERCAGEFIGLMARNGLACARRIAAPARTMVVIANRRAGVELIEANSPGDGRETARECLQRLLAVRERGGRLRHPPAVNGLEAGVWLVRPIVGDLPFRETRQDQRDPKQLVRLPGQALQSPKQPRAGTVAPEEAGAGRLHEGVDLGLRHLEVFFENAKKLLRSRFSIKGEVILLGEEFVRRQRGQQAADHQINPSPDIDAESLAEESVAMDGKQDERFTDAFAQGT